MKKQILLLSLSILFMVTLKAQKTDQVIDTQEQITESVKLAPCRSQDRLDAVKRLFVSMGARENEVKVEQFRKISNVVVTKKGKTAETIIIGAHYDKTENGCGAIDNWTGVSILAHLYRTLNKFDTQKTYIFTAFDQEEKGLLGSEAMVKAIPKENRKNYCSMVNLDSFGMANPQIMLRVSNSKMTKFAQNLAQDLKYQVSEMFLEKANADSTSFLYYDIPAITFIGLDRNWRNYLHTKEDKPENIKMDKVYLSYRFVLDFVSKLDVEGCQVFR